MSSYENVIEECKTASENTKMWQISNKSGDALVTFHQVFPGIQLIFSDVHMESVSFDDNAQITHNVFEISHCREGRMECHVNEEFCYLTQGDLAIVRTNGISSTSFYPLHHYHGITVRIDVDNAPECLSLLLEDVFVRPKELAKKFCDKNKFYVARSSSSFEHIFSELYSVPIEIQKGYFKIKVLELLLFLDALEVSENEINKRSYSRTQVSLAKNVSSYLHNHMDERITLEQLSNVFYVSGTHIKNSIKAVYGTSLYSFIRTQKMESAAFMLRYTDKSILEISNLHGYDNASKFSSAFRNVIGLSPNEYRASTDTKPI